MKLLLVLVSALGFVLGYEEPIVKIPQGSVQGTHQTSYSGRTYSAFEGIPYAKPPVGDLRFEEPQPPENWNGVLRANHTYMCMCFIPLPIMHGPHGTEDCLYIYVYVPREKIDVDENLDVVVYIHGGAFMVGAPKYMAGPSFIMDEDVIYVSFNYRLTIFGFLSTEDDVVPGNNGLKDQSLALKWIKNNVKYFGGNPDSITIIGLSAGGASVHYHYLSSWSKGLFNRGFSQSGTALQHWTLIKEPLARAKAIADHLDCSTDSTKIMVECMKNVPGEQLVMATKSLFVFMDIIPFTLFGPVIEKGENPFLHDHPYKLLKEGKVYDVPWVVSNVKNEGIFPAGFFVAFNTLTELDKRWNDIIPFALDINETVRDADDKLHAVTKIREYYFGKEPLTKDNIYSLVQLFTDRTYLIDSEKAIRAHSKAVKSPVYFYFFTYLLHMRSLFSQMEKGVAHGDDGRILFPILSTPRVLQEDDERMMRLFTGFAATYAKSNKPSFNDVDWKPVDPQSADINYLHIASPDDISMKTMKNLTRTEFWDSLPIKENDKLL